jgi:hypothetical protein
MRVGFDLDGTLDRPRIAELAKVLAGLGHEVHCITGVFPEAVGWQDAAAKRRKMRRLGFPFVECRHPVFTESPKWPVAEIGELILHILDAVPATFDRAYRLADLGLRKGALCEELGIELFIEDSELYAEMIPKMSGATTVLLVC